MQIQPSALRPIMAGNRNPTGSHVAEALVADAAAQNQDNLAISSAAQARRAVADTEHGTEAAAGKAEDGAVQQNRQTDAANALKATADQDREAGADQGRPQASASIQAVAAIQAQAAQAPQNLLNMLA